MQGFWNEMEKLGKDRNPYRAGFLQFVGVAESRQQALDLYSEPASISAAAFVDPRRPAAGLHDRRHAPASGHDDKAANLANPATRPRSRHQHEGHRRRRVRADRFARRVIEQIRHVGTSLNVGHLMLLCSTAT